MKILKENDFYKTADLALCGALSVLGFGIEALDRQNPLRVAFLIRRTNELDEIIRLFFTHELKVDPLAYFNALRDLKTRLYNGS